ncbi:hypothetical protein K1W54_09315 [Micromonospora sp. CPCC 205371]|nr:hypothetical protein [Micromonospora sp. CPCC 205371]
MRAGKYVMAAVVAAASLLVAPTVPARAQDTGRPATVDTEKPVRGAAVPVRPRTPDPAAGGMLPAPDWAAAKVSADRGARVRVQDRAGRLAFTVDSVRPATARVDYSAIAGAYGGSYGSRLRLVRASDGAPVPTTNDVSSRTLTVEVPAGTTALVAVAGAAGDQGDYRATSLSASATWNACGNSGDFTWSYPLRVPPVPGGLEPDLGISYSSASVDGRTSNTNNQPSWVGDGFDLWPGYVERSYKGCADDGAPESNGVAPGDQCWAYDNATVTWNGKGGELVKGGDGTWRLKNDDGTRFEKLTGAAGTGDNDGEYWKATTTDGTQYFFGKHRLPGWADGKPVTNSTWTVPVFGNNEGEPCHDAAGFAQSSCQQAYRWNLDYVVETNGNAVSYYYTVEGNKYGRNVTLSADTAYDRGGYLNRIEYGLRSTDLFATPPARVVFSTAERCLTTDTFDCAEGKIGANPDRWPDVPWDQHCTADCAKAGKISPTFWTRKRLTGVTTQIRSGSAWRQVDAWKLAHHWGDADIDRALLLQSIEHVGLPKVTFNHVQAKNRVDRSGDDISPFVKYRLGAVFDETGGQIDVKYSEADCSPGGLPTPETNTRRCFPIWWQPAGQDKPIRDWFHKYVVTQVIRSDRTARAPDMVTNYEYLGGAAWHFDDDDGLTKTKEKSWSQWRGYGHVKVTTGGINAPVTRDEYLYLRGMDGDRLNTSGGTKNVTVSDGEGSPPVVDHEALAGFQLKHTVYTGVNGSVHRKTVNTPWRHQTASRTRPWGTTTATLTGTATTRTWTAMDGGGWRQTRTDTAHDPVTGLATQVDDQGDVAVSTDDLCTRTTYAANTTAWIRSLPSRAETVSARCGATPDRATDVVSDTRTFYDGGGFGAAPTRGNATRVERIATHDGTTATYVPSTRTTYDAYGRVTTETDAADTVTTMSYVETDGLTTWVSTTVAGHVTSKKLDPAWGAPVEETDAGEQTTTMAYDGLGRLAKVWQPGRAGADVADAEFTYQVAEGQIVAVTTKTIAKGDTQRTSVELLDGFLRSRQTQAPGPDGGRLITDTFYDSRGNVARTYDTYPAAGAPATALFGVAVPGAVESQTAYQYDGMNRVTVERFLAGNNDSQEKWRTVTSYGGAWVAVDPPAGGTPTRTVTDARGRKTELRQYKGASPTGDYESTRYTYHPDGKLATIDTAGQAWSYTYDLRGRQVRATDPHKGTTVSTYDDLDRLASTTDARGQKVFHTYDALGRKTETHEGSATGPLRASWLFDTLRKGQLTSATRYQDGKAFTTKVDAYDFRNRPTRITVTIPDGYGALSGAYGFSTAYNLDGTVQSTGYPAAGGLPAETVVQTYDGIARPTRLTSNLGTYVDATVYSATGKPLQYELTTGGKKAWQTFTFEYGTNRLATSRTDREGIAGVDRNATYAYDPAGNITSISDVSRTGTDTQCFIYDHVRRLREAWTQGVAACAATPSTSVVAGPAPYWHSYTYDGAGNRATETLHGVGGGADTIRAYANQGHRLTGVSETGGAGAHTSTYGYDATGNMITRAVGGVTQTLNWDAEGDLTSVVEGAKTTSFVYDAGGARLLRRDPSGTTLYLPGMELHQPTGSGAANGTRYYEHNGENVALRTVKGVRFLAKDHQDTAQLAIDPATQALTQRRFTPFGAARGTPAGAWPDEKTFVGGTKDASTGLTHLGAREYDPAIGRFVSVDPLVLDDPQQMHGYSYANYTPITKSDPTGLYPCGGTGGGGGGRWVLASIPQQCDDDNSKRGFEPARPPSGGGGSGGGGYAGGGGYSGGGGGGYRPPPIGPIRKCEGWCAVKDNIGDRQNDLRGTKPDLPRTLNCNYGPNPNGPYPVAKPCGHANDDVVNQFLKGLWETCKKYKIACISVPEELLAPLVVGGMFGAFFWMLAESLKLSALAATGVATCAVACTALLIAGSLVFVLVAFWIAFEIYGEIHRNAVKEKDHDKPSHPDS